MKSKPIELGAEASLRWLTGRPINTRQVQGKGNEDADILRQCIRCRAWKAKVNHKDPKWRDYETAAADRSV
jgi:hypothetical protein